MVEPDPSHFLIKDHGETSIKAGPVLQQPPLAPYVSSEEEAQPAAEVAEGSSPVTVLVWLFHRWALPLRAAGA